MIFDGRLVFVEIGVNSERTVDLLCRFSFLVSRFSFLVSRFSFLVSRFSFLGGSVTAPLKLTLKLEFHIRGAQRATRKNIIETAGNE